MKKFYLFLFVLLFCITLTAQIKPINRPLQYNNHSTLKVLSDSVQQEWYAIYNGNGEDHTTGLAVDNSGNVYVTGYSKGSGTQYDYATIKYNKSGSEDWVARYNGPANSNDEASAIAVDDSGNVFVTGSSVGSSGTEDYATIKYDSAGTEKWVAYYNDPSNSWDKANAIAVDDSDNVYVTGTSDGSTYTTIKYDSKGTAIWITGNNNYGYAVALAIDNSGNTYVTGKNATVKYDNTGTQKWVAVYNGIGYGGYLKAITVDSSGNVYVAGGCVQMIDPEVLYDYATIKYNKFGSQQWVKTHDGSDHDMDMAEGIVVDKSGNVFVTGWSRNLNSDYDYVTIKYSRFGGQDWIATYNEGGHSEDLANGIAIDDSGNVYVTGYSVAYGIPYHYVTIKYNTDGTQKWRAIFNGPNNNYVAATVIKLDDSANVYVTGDMNFLYSNSDYATVKYKQIPILIPLAPANLQASIDTMTVSLSWQDNSDNETGFVVERKIGDSTSSNPFAAIDTVGENVTAYIDTSFESDTLYSYRVYAYNSYGNSGYSNIVTVDVPFPTGVKGNTNVPLQFSIEQNYPNPFNPSTKISWQSPESSWQTLIVYDVLGREVATLVNEYKRAGKYEVEFNAANLPSGIYFYKLTAGKFSQVKKMILLK